MHAEQLQGWLGLVVVGVGAAGATGAAVRWLVRPVARMSQLVEAQLVPNGGSTLVDKVSKLHAVMFPEDADGNALPSVVERMTSVEGTVAELGRQVEQFRKQLAMDPFTTSKIAMKLVTDERMPQGVREVLERLIQETSSELPK